MRNSRDKERRMRRAKGQRLVGKATNIYNAGLPLGEQKTRKLKISLVEASKRQRQKRQEPRDDNQQGKAQKGESLNV